jgi:hypothetical protein
MKQSPNFNRRLSPRLAFRITSSPIIRPTSADLQNAWPQRTMPDWARGHMNATMVMVAQAATALGGVVWGLAAHYAGVVPTFLGAAVTGILLMIIVRVVPALQISIDFAKSLSSAWRSRDYKSKQQRIHRLVPHYATHPHCESGKGWRSCDHVRHHSVADLEKGTCSNATSFNCKLSDRLIPNPGYDFWRQESRNPRGH